MAWFWDWAQSKRRLKAPITFKQIELQVNACYLPHHYSPESIVNAGGMLCSFTYELSANGSKKIGLTLQREAGW